MQFTSLLVAALLPVGLLAAPVADGVGQSEVTDGRQIFERAGQLCRIVGGADYVHCRTGAGTNYPYHVSLAKSWTRGYYFTCVKSGECITLNGAVNWYVLTRDN